MSVLADLNALGNELADLIALDGSEDIDSAAERLTSIADLVARCFPGKIGLAKRALIQYRSSGETEDSFATSAIFSNEPAFDPHFGR